MLEIFKFLSKFLGFKGVSPRKKVAKTKKKLKSLNFMVWWRDVLIKHSQDELCAKFCVLLEIFKFWTKFLSFKGVSPRQNWRNPKKKLKSLIFMVWWREVLIILSLDELCSEFWVLLEIFKFGSKILSFRGASPRKKWWNLLKKIFNIHGMMKGYIN